MCSLLEGNLEEKYFSREMFACALSIANFWEDVCLLACAPYLPIAIK